jgi:phospholipid/cholesterol/gamma-HCH transport system substrate-binding protein
MKKYKMESLVGIFVIIGLFGVGYLTVNLGKISLFGDNSYPLYAQFSSVSGLRAGSPVEILGIEVGRVERLTIDEDKQMALAKLRIKKDVKVFDDAIASIKTAGLIGDKFIKIEPGGGGDIIKPGGMITETASPLDIEELISKYAFGDIKKDTENESE